MLYSFVQQKRSHWFVVVMLILMSFFVGIGVGVGVGIGASADKDLKTEICIVQQIQK